MAYRQVSIEALRALVTTWVEQGYTTLLQGNERSQIPPDSRAFFEKFIDPLGEDYRPVHCEIGRLIFRNGHRIRVTAEIGTSVEHYLGLDSLGDPMYEDSFEIIKRKTVYTLLKHRETDFRVGLEPVIVDTISILTHGPHGLLFWRTARGLEAALRCRCGCCIASQAVPFGAGRLLFGGICKGCKKHRECHVTLTSTFEKTAMAWGVGEGVFELSLLPFQRH